MRKQLTINDVQKFILRQFDHIKSSNDIKKLVKFHTNNKYLLMAHSQNELKTLGNLVANRKKASADRIFQEYEKYLRLALSKEATKSSHVNALSHIYGHFKKKLNDEEKKLFLNAIDDFKFDNVSLGMVLNIVKIYIDKFENNYLLRQTYYLLYSDVEGEWA